MSDIKPRRWKLLELSISRQAKTSSAPGSEADMESTGALDTALGRPVQPSNASQRSESAAQKSESSS
eukprot:1752834-Rhodomonas_salina.4